MQLINFNIAEQKLREFIDLAKEKHCEVFGILTEDNGLYGFAYFPESVYKLFNSEFATEIKFGALEGQDVNIISEGTQEKISPVVYCAISPSRVCIGYDNYVADFIKVRPLNTLFVLDNFMHIGMLLGTKQTERMN